MRTILLAIFAVAVVYVPAEHNIGDLYDLPKQVWLSVAGVAIWFHFYTRAVEGRRVEFPLWGLIVGFLGLELASAVNAPNVYNVIERTFLDALYFSIFWFAASVPRAKAEQVLRIAPLFVVPAMIAAIVGVGPSDLSGPFGNIEHGSSVMVAAGLLSVAFGLPWLVLGPAILVHLIVAGARSAVAGLVLALGVLVIARLKIREFLIFAVTIAGVVVTVWWWNPPPTYWHVGPLRVEYWRVVLSEIPEAAILGHGRGNYKLYAHQFLYQTREAEEMSRRTLLDRLHNDYLQLWFEVGTPALILFLWLLWRLLWPIPGAFLGQMVFVALGTFLIQAFFLFPFEVAGQAGWFWALAGVYWRIRSEERP